MKHIKPPRHPPNKKALKTTQLHRPRPAFSKAQSFAPLSAPPNPAEKALAPASQVLSPSASGAFSFLVGPCWLLVAGCCWLLVGCLSLWLLFLTSSTTPSASSRWLSPAVLRASLRSGLSASKSPEACGHVKQQRLSMEKPYEKTWVNSGTSSDPFFVFSRLLSLFFQLITYSNISTPLCFAIKKSTTLKTFRKKKKKRLSITHVPQPCGLHVTLPCLCQGLWQTRRAGQLEAWETTRKTIKKWRHFGVVYCGFKEFENKKHRSYSQNVW